MDEPLARLDAHLRVQMRQEFRLLQQGYGVTTVFVTNDQDEALVMADRIAVLKDGRLQQVAAPLELYHRPISKCVAQFVGLPPMGFVAGKVIADRPGYWLTFGDFRLRVWAPQLGEAPGGDVEVGVRAEDVLLDPNGTEVLVGRGYYLGSHGFAQVQLSPGAFVAMRTDDVPPQEGSRVRVRLRHLHVFHPSTGSVLGRIEDGAA